MSEVIVTREQREQEIKNREEMMKAADALPEDERKKFIEGLSVRDRLMRRGSASRVKTVIKDDVSEFTILTREFTTEEWDRASGINEKLASAKGDFKAYREVLNEMRAFLPNVTVTPDIDWGDGVIGDDVVILALLNTLMATSRSVKEGIASFRPV